MIGCYLRHEAGHAFHLCLQVAQHSRVEEDFLARSGGLIAITTQPAPFSRDYVRHLRDGMPQKHPDEDFAETFAVWLTPRSNWRKRYRGWGG